MKNHSKLYAALIGSFFFLGQPIYADVPVVRSQADHNRTVLNSAQQGRAPDSELMQSLLFQVQELQGLVSEQRGLIEELTYRVEQLSDQQKDRYVDLDRRIQQLQQGGGLIAAGDGTSSQSQLTQNDQAIIEQYNKAKALMLERKFASSIEELEAFAQAHPSHSLAGNAWYWIGEIYLVQRQPEKANEAFKTIMQTYPKHDKMPDSLYKLGVIAQQSAKAELARQYFERVISEYPQSQSARLAQSRLSL